MVLTRAFFEINKNTGELEFNNAPDYEDPQDSNNDNYYIVQITVTDSGGLTTVQYINVHVTDFAIKKNTDWIPEEKEFNEGVATTMVKVPEGRFYYGI